MSARSNPIDAVEDLWTIFECPDDNCGQLFFGEEILYNHVKINHPELTGQPIFSVDLIRAIPQDEVRK